MSDRCFGEPGEGFSFNFGGESESPTQPQKKAKSSNADPKRLEERDKAEAVPAVEATLHATFAANCADQSQCPPMIRLRSRRVRLLLHRRKRSLSRGAIAAMLMRPRLGSQVLATRHKTWASLSLEHGEDKMALYRGHVTTEVSLSPLPPQVCGGVLPLVFGLFRRSGRVEAIVI